MSEQAGRLSLDVEANTRGLAADIRRKVQEATNGITAKVKADVDTRALQAAVRAAALEASQAATIKLTIEVDSRGLNAQVRAIALEASQAAKIRLDVDVDTKGTNARVKAAVEEATAGAKAPTIKPKVEPDTAPATREIERFRLREALKSIKLKVDVDTKGADSKLLSVGFGITKVVGIAGIIGSAIGPVLNLVGGLGQVAAGLFAIVANASQAAGAIAAIPGALAGAVAVVGVIKTAFSGIGAALKASDQQAATGAKQSTDLAAQRVASARRVVDAQTAISRAQENVGLTAASGALAITQAERRIIDTQNASKRAQQDLTKARDEARAHLEDLRLTLQGAALDEESAQLAVERALQRRTESLNSPLTSSLDKREADLAYREAVQHLAEVKEANTDLRKTAADDVKKGVEGADNVVAAQSQVVQSVQDEKDARDELGRTIDSAARANRDAAQQVTSAQQGLADASAAAAKEQSAATSSASAYQTAMGKLSPAGQSLVKFLNGTYIPAWRTVKTAVQEALLPAVQSGLQTTLRLVEPVRVVAVATATALGHVFTLFADTITTPQWIADIKTLGTNNAGILETLGTALVGILTPLKDLAVVSSDGPNSFFGRFAAWTKGLSENATAAVGAARANGDLAAFFDRTGDVLAQWGTIIGNIATAIFNIGKQSSPAGQKLTDAFQTATENFLKFTEDNGPAIKQFFDDLVPVMQAFGDIIVGVAKILVNIMKDPNNLKMMQAIRDVLVPALQRLVQAFLDSGNAEKFVQIISDLGDAIANLVNSGALSAFTDELGSIVGWLKDFTADPGNAELFKNLFQLAAIVGPLALVAGSIGKIAGGLAGIGKNGKGSAALGLLLAGGGQAVAATADPKDTSQTGNAKRFAGDVGTGAGAGLVTGGPLGAVYGGLAGAFKHAVTNFDDTKGSIGRFVLDQLTTVGLQITLFVARLPQTLGNIKAAVTTWVAENIVAPIKGIGAQIGDGADVVGGFVLGIAQNLAKFKTQVGQVFYDNFIAPFKTFFGIKSPSTLMAGLAGDVVAGFINGVSVLGTRFAAYITTLPATLLASFTAVKTWVSARATEWRDNAVSLVTQIGPKISAAVAAFPGVIAGAFTGLRTYFSTRLGELAGTAGAAMLAVSNAIQGYLNRLPGAFGTAVSLITATWNGLRSAASAPVKFVIDTVYNNGLRAVWNKVIDVAHIPGVGQLPAVSANFAGGGVIPGYTPGRDPYLVPGPNGNVGLSGGEGILVPEAVRGLARRLRMTTSSAIDYLNGQFTQRVTPGRAERAHSAVDPESHAIGGITDGGGGGGRQYWPGTSNWLDAKTYGILQAVQRVVGPLRVLQGSWSTSVAASGGTHSGAGAADWWPTRGSADAAVAVARQDGGVAWHRYPSQGPWAEHIHMITPGVPGTAPGALQQIESFKAGGNGLAGGGKDDGPRGFVQNIISGVAGFLGGIKDMASGFLDPVRKSIGALGGSGFAGLAKGTGQGMLDALVKRFTGFDGGLFDNGGVFPSGTTGRNESGSPEVVFTQPQWSTLSRIAAAGVRASSGRPGSSGAPTYGTYIADGAIRVVVNNPVGETTDTSINARMRALSDLGLFENAGAA